MNFTSFFLELVSVAWEQGIHTHCSTCVWSDLYLTLIYIHTYTDIDTHIDIDTQNIDAFTQCRDIHTYTDIDTHINISIQHIHIQRHI